MNSKLAITAIVMFAVVMGIASMAPAMADRANAPGQNKENICHVEFAEDGITVESIDLINVPLNSAHFKLDKNGDLKHPADFPPTDVGEGVFECVVEE